MRCGYEQAYAVNGALTSSEIKKSINAVLLLKRRGGLVRRKILAIFSTKNVRKIVIVK